MFELSRDVLSQEPLHVAVAGVGGTGSEVISGLINLHHALVAFGYGGIRVSAFDPDTVSPANIVRQRYTQADLGRAKATTLINRVNLACGFDWLAFDRKFDGDAARGSWDVVVSCVDTRAARRSLHKAAFADGFRLWKFWLDIGNDETTGQAILGTPRNRKKKVMHMLPCATELHPELMDTSLPEDDRPSCSAIEALAKQDLFVNKRAALAGLDLLWELFHERCLRHHGVYFDLRARMESPLTVMPKPKRTREAA
jgi:PRTRC genetic system ThiF family protein